MLIKIPWNIRFLVTDSDLKYEEISIPLPIFYSSVLIAINVTNVGICIAMTVWRTWHLWQAASHWVLESMLNLNLEEYSFDYFNQLLALFTIMYFHICDLVYISPAVCLHSHMYLIKTMLFLAYFIPTPCPSL